MVTSKEHGGLGIKNVRLQLGSLVHVAVEVGSWRGRAMGTWVQLVDRDASTRGESETWPQRLYIGPLLFGGYLLLQGCSRLWRSCSIGKRRHELFWMDRWCGESSLEDLFPTLFAIAANPLGSVSKAFDHLLPGGA